MDYSLCVLFIPIQKLLSRLMYQFVVIAPIIAYAMHSHISYILEANSKGHGIRIHFFGIFLKFKYFGDILIMLHEE